MQTYFADGKLCTIPTNLEPELAPNYSIGVKLCGNSRTMFSCFATYDGETGEFERFEQITNCGYHDYIISWAELSRILRREDFPVHDFQKSLNLALNEIAE